MIIKLLSLFSIVALAYIPRGMLILHRTAENSGNGIYQIEQEVQFPTTQENVVLKETWIVENDTNMRVTVTGGKDLKNLIRMSFIYKGGEKIFTAVSGHQTKKIDDDFFEKYFHFRSSERLANNLIQLKVAPPSILNQKVYRNTKEIEHTPESFIHLARIGGVPAYGFGTPTSSEKEAFPGLWIEQDQFVIRKIRLPSGSEITADRYGVYSRGLNFPRSRFVRWDNNTVSIQTLSVRSIPTNSQLFSTTTLEPNRTEGLDQTGVRSLIEDFYARFR